MTRPDLRRPRIIWDLDDTLNELMKQWLAWHQRESGGDIVFEAITENPPHRLLQLERTDYLASLDRFRNSSEARDMKPVPAVCNWFEQYGFRFDHHVVTARPIGTVPAAAEWVFRHFGRWIRHFHFSPARREEDQVPDSGASKREIIANFQRADFFVDDSAENLEQARDLVDAPLLFPQPWNSARRSSIADLLAVLSRAVA